VILYRSEYSALLKEKNRKAEMFFLWEGAGYKIANRKRIEGIREENGNNTLSVQQ